MIEVTRILSAIDQGHAHAAAQLLPLVYDELRKLAARSTFCSRIAKDRYNPQSGLIARPSPRTLMRWPKNGPARGAVVPHFVTSSGELFHEPNWRSRS